MPTVKGEDEGDSDQRPVDHDGGDGSAIPAGEVANPDALQDHDRNGIGMIPDEIGSEPAAKADESGGRDAAKNSGEDHKDRTEQDIGAGGEANRKLIHPESDETKQEIDRAASQQAMPLGRFPGVQGGEHVPRVYSGSQVRAT